MVGPIGALGHAPGLLILVSAPGERFERAHEAIARELLEPFAAALRTIAGCAR